MATQKKQDTVKTLTAELTKTKALFITDYRGLKHKDLETLRKSLKKVDAKFVVAKNTLMKIALRGSEFKGVEADLSKELTDQTGSLLAMGDTVAAIKALSTFIKTNQLPKVKTGVFEGKVVSAGDFTKLSSLPSREQLLSMLAMRLKGPIYALHRASQWNMQSLVVALNNVKGKKTA